MALNIGKLWSVDLFESKKKHYLIGVDKVFKYMMVRQVPNQKTNTITNVLEEWTLTFNLPLFLKYDGGPASRVDLSRSS